MKKTYYLIKRTEPCGPALKIRRFRAGISSRERKWLNQIAFLAKSRNAYISEGCIAQQEFFTKLAKQIYGDTAGALPAFLIRNVVDVPIVQLRDDLRYEAENRRSVERQLDFQNQPAKTIKI